MKNKIKVIFLDIDGVLSPHVLVEEQQKNNFPYSVEFNSKAVSNLKKLLKKSGAKIVLSTSWIKTLGFKATVLTLASHGIKGPYVLPEDLGEQPEKLYQLDWIDANSNKFYGTAVTPKKMSSEKCHEISFWLNEYAEQIEGYVVLDDDFIHFQEGYQVEVDGMKGLTNTDVNKALKILNQGMKLYEEKH